MKKSLYFDRGKFEARCARLGPDATIAELNEAFSASLSSDNPKDEIFQKLIDPHFNMGYDDDLMIDDSEDDVVEEYDNIFADTLLEQKANPAMCKLLRESDFFDGFNDDDDVSEYSDSFGIGLDDPYDYDDIDYMSA